MAKIVSIPEFTPRNDEPADMNFHLRIPRSLRSRIDGVKQRKRAQEVNRYYRAVIEAATAALEEQERASERESSSTPVLFGHNPGVHAGL